MVRATHPWVEGKVRPFFSPLGVSIYLSYESILSFLAFVGLEICFCLFIIYGKWNMIPFLEISMWKCFFKVTKCILSNYHMHCSKKEPLPSVTWILVILPFHTYLMWSYRNIKTFVKAESLLLHNTEPHATASLVIVEPQRPDMEHHSEWQLQVAGGLPLSGLGSEMTSGKESF